VSLATVIVMGGRNEPGSPPQSPHSSRASEASSGPTASPLMVDRPFNALERQLLFHIPPDLRPRCGPALEQQEEADASIACRVDDSVRAYYYHYGSVEAMDGEFDNVAVSLGQEGNNCALDHNAVQSYTVGGHPVGRVLCLRTESDSRIEWTDPRFLILSLALRADLGDQDLYEWWKQAAGPMETGSTDVAPKGPSVPIATLPDESYLTSVDARDVARPRLRFQSGIKGVSTPSGWIGLWALRLSDGTYSVTQDGRTVEQGTVALGKGHEAEFTATSGDCAGRTAATAKYVWRLTADVAMFLNTQGGAYCAGPFPINIDSWIAVSGGELAFTGSGPNLELMSIDGTDRRLLTSNGFQPDWSPDGSRLAFGRGDGGEARIFLVNADGSGATQLDHGPGYEDTPRWSPDGSEIAFVRRRDIFVMDDAGGNVHPLIATPANEGWVSWFPDGSGVVFSKGGLHPLSSGAEVAGRADIFVADLSGRVQHRLTQGSGANVAPAPSPDSKTIAFFGNQGGKLDLYLMDRDGTNVRKLVDVGSEEQVGYPTWSPDGSLIAYPRTRNGDTEIFLTTANGQAAVQLTHGNSAEPCWRPGSNS